ncbi:MAG: amidohydrolase [Clostridia bacterium]|nr:amidohydrolase [Clostridia bacterium]
MRDNLEMARSVFAEAVQLRHHLHQNPELSGEEHNTLAFIVEYLKSLGVNYRVHGNGGVTATIGQGSRAVGVRGDMDALPVQEDTGLEWASCVPGVMHACGHDVHTAILMGAAKMFKTIEDELPCAVKLFFQPAEETVGGAKDMIDEGCMENPNVDRVLGIHVDPTIPLGSALFLPGKMNAAVIDLKITVCGSGCHGAHPEQGIDAIVTAAHIITALQTIDSRLTAPTEPVVVTIGSIHGGTGSNIVAGEVILKGTVRVLSMDTAAVVKKHLRTIITSVAAAWGAQADIELIDNYPALVNDKAVTNLMAEEARRLIGEKNVILADTPSMGADDFAYFTNAAPGCYFNIGTAEPGKPLEALHSATYAPHDDCILTGLALVSAGLWALMEKSL